MSERLCADVDNSEMWFTAFTDVLLSLLNQDKESNLTSDQISEALLSIEVTMLVDATLDYIRHCEISVFQISEGSQVKKLTRSTT